MGLDFVGELKDRGSTCQPQHLTRQIQDTKQVGT